MEQYSIKIGVRVNVILVCDAIVVYIWYECGDVKCPCGVHMVPMLCECDTYVLFMWCSCGTIHVIPMWCACDIHVLWKWYPFGVHVNSVLLLCKAFKVGMVSHWFFSPCRICTSCLLVWGWSLSRSGHFFTFFFFQGGVKFDFKWTKNFLWLIPLLAPFPDFSRPQSTCGGDLIYVVGG